MVITGAVDSRKGLEVGRYYLRGEQSEEPWPLLNQGHLRGSERKGEGTVLTA